jgi:hypothetical protein
MNVSGNADEFRAAYRMGIVNPPLKLKKKPRGTPFKPGNCANPTGYNGAPRDMRRRVAALLEAACVQPDGTDLLINALMAGVLAAEPQLTKLAAEYRWGKPVQPIEGEIAPASLDALLASLPEALAILESSR